MASYKSIHKAIEECIIPMVLKKMIYSHQDAMPDRAHLWMPTLNNINSVMLSEFYQVMPKLRPSFEKIVNRVASEVIKYMEKDDFKTTKGFMTMVIIGQNKGVPPPIEEILDDITMDMANRLCKKDYDKNLDNVLESAKKQAPKVLRVIQKLGYFRG